MSGYVTKCATCEGRGWYVREGESFPVVCYPCHDAKVRADRADKRAAKPPRDPAKKVPV